MATRDSIKKEIDQLPENLLGQVDQLIRSLVRPPRARKPISGYKLGGHFDKVPIREQSYE